MYVYVCMHSYEAKDNPHCVQSRTGATGLCFELYEKLMDAHKARKVSIEFVGGLA